MAGTVEKGPAGPKAPDPFELGTVALNEGKYASAHRLLQEALEKERSADHLSQYALALAHHTGNVQSAITLCREAIKLEPRNPEHFLRLAIVYLIGGNKKQAIRMLHLGQRFGRHAGIARMLQALGLRRKPVIPFLSRANPLNKYLGKMRGLFNRR